MGNTSELSGAISLVTGGVSGGSETLQVRIDLHPYVP